MLFWQKTRKLRVWGDIHALLIKTAKLPIHKNIKPSVLGIFG
jgi:hypothetical protein